MDPLIAELKKVQRRMVAQRWLHRSLMGLMWGSGAAMVWVILTRLFPVLGDPGVVGLAFITVGFLAGTATAIARRPSLVDAALAADRKLGLKERLTSSLELAETDGPMIEALHADARRRLAQLNVPRQFPLTLARPARWAPVPLLLFGALYLFLPEFDVFNQEQRAVEAKAQQEERTVHAERLRDAVKTLQAEKVDVEGLDDIGTSLEKLAADFEANAITEKQALARLSKLTDTIQQRRDALAEHNPAPKLANRSKNLGLANEFAAALQRGNMREAAQKADELQKKIRNGELSREEAKKLSKDLAELSKMLGGPNSELGAALAKSMSDAAAFLESGDLEAAEAALEELELSVEDLQSILDQLDKLNTTVVSLAEWKQGFLGPSEFCRLCGAQLAECNGEGGECEASAGHHHHGICGSCAGLGTGAGAGLGLRGPGRGAGNQVGDLPDVDVGLNPTKAPGPMTRGRMLADILQRSAPEEGEEATIDFVQSAFVDVQQAAEQALTQEEIPAASREFVRQYFGSLEPEQP